MTKADIVENVYEKVGGFSKKEAAEIVETVFDTIKETLERGEKIKISGFGNFVVRQKNERIGRNPQTNEPITISARRVLTFKPSQVPMTTKITLTQAIAMSGGFMPDAARKKVRLLRQDSASGARLEKIFNIAVLRKQFRDV